MSSSDLLAAQNPWWADPRARPAGPERPRSLFARLHRTLAEPDLRRAQVLLGPRQVGKTTLLGQLARRFLDDGWPAANVLYFDFQDDRYDHSHDLREIVEARPPGRREDHPALILLDEVTHAPRWDVSLKRLVDGARTAPGGLQHRILVTDSAAALMRGGARDSLQGRIDETRMHGLTFEEALRLQSREHESVRDAFLRVPGALERFLARGGFPEHVATEPPERVWERIRRDAADRAIARDLAREKNVDVERITALFRHLVQKSGALFEANNQARDLQAPGEKGPDVRTVRGWVALLKEGCLVEGLGPWHAGLGRGVDKASRALKVRQKLYAEDHGLVPAFSPFASPMTNDDVRTRVFETVIFTHLRALRDARGDFELFYFREDEKVEIDFVLRFDGAVLGLEATSSTIPEKKLPTLKRAKDRAGLDRVIAVHGGPLPPRETAEWSAHPLDSFLLDPGSIIDEALAWIRKSR
ncbi:MAG: ATP-binding protein [Planctomycetota bacterium]